MKNTFTTLVLIFLILGFTPQINAETVSHSFSIDSFSMQSSFTETILKIDGFNSHFPPGCPDLPVKKYVIALPPHCVAQSVNVTSTTRKPLPGKHRVKPAIIVYPRQDRHGQPDLYSQLEALYSENVTHCYRRESTGFPEKACRIVGQGFLGPIPYVEVSFSPFTYFSGSSQLEYCASGQIEVTFKRQNHTYKNSSQCSEDHLIQAHQVFDNFASVQEYYDRGIERFRRNTGYIIITASDLVLAISTSNFISWKQSIGLLPEIVTTSDPRITGQSGVDLAEKIRNYLRVRYNTSQFDYVLLVGDVDTIPMRYCYPEPMGHVNGVDDPSCRGDEVPTDYYYADLSAPDAQGWDLDGDGYHGEFGQDMPDLFAEVAVGRIPTSNAARITYALNKSVTFEQDLGAWKNNALHAGAFYYFTNEDHTGMDADDGATCPDYLENDLMSGWTISHYSEQEGLEKSAYSWPALAEKPFAEDWELGQYGIVNEGAHGATDQVARKLWLTDDGDGVPESSEITWNSFLDIDSKLDDDYPSIFCAMSCLVGYPESHAYGNLGIDLVTKPGWGAAVAAVVSSRIVYGPLDWTPQNGGGCESVCYEFNRYMINDELPVGTAMYRGKLYTHLNFSMGGYTEYITMFEYNLFGDPSLVRVGVDPLATPVPTATPVQTPTPAPEPLVLYIDDFEAGVTDCTGPFGDTGCSSQWISYYPPGGGYPAACDGTRIAWHEYEPCNSPHGPDHFLIMNGSTTPEHDMTGFTDLTLSLDWYYNNNAYGETVEVWAANAPFGSLDCSDLSAPWELLYSETDEILHVLGACVPWELSLPASYDNAENLIIAIRYYGFDGDTVGIDSMSLSGMPPATPTPVPVPSSSEGGIVVILIGISIILIIALRRQ